VPASSNDAHAHALVPSPFLPGRNCWRTASTSRVAVLIDAAAYFDAVVAAIARAQRSVLILSWDVDSRTPLGGGYASRRLGEVLHAALERKPKLDVHVLNWDFALIYVLERELFAAYRREWYAHPRLHFRTDGTHPLGACHHQKVVVVDDAVAFSGGLDICSRRWDTPAHDPDDARRVDLAGVPYPPFHDVQIAVDGEAARALGDLARERWRQATGETLAPPAVRGDPWPKSVTPDFTNVEVAIARTIPAYDGTPAVREVETLFRDAIHAARRWIYAENQYLTWPGLADALLARLAEADGPEVVIVVPREGCGWLEEQTMSMRRARVVERLRAGDRHGRLRIVAPVIEGDVAVNVHSKVMIADDTFLRVGSANLSSRSMAVDTECDVALAGTDDEIRTGIAAVRDRLLADHLGVTASEVASAFAETGSLIATIERLHGRPHTLQALPAREPGWLDGLPDEAHVFDPPEPIDAGRLLVEVLPATLPSPPPSLLRFARVAAVLLGAVALGVGLGRLWCRIGQAHPRTRLVGHG
jgi:phosphatidylserine/phosphatidylglycerophosphate/cardiolipin synthase-like enzyme